MNTLKNVHGAPKVVTLTPEALTNHVKEAVISILLIHGLTKEKLLAEFQAMLTKAIAEIIPKHDPEASIYLNATEAAEFMKCSRTTINEYKKKIVNGKPVLQFGGPGKIKKISQAECRRVMDMNIINTRSSESRRITKNTTKSR